MHVHSNIPFISLLLHAAFFSTTYFVDAAPSSPAGNATAFLTSAWWPSWQNREFPPSKIDWKQYDIVKYAFLPTQADRPYIGFFDASLEPAILNTFIQEAHNAGKKAYVSCGGWTGSRFFSSATQTAENRTAFVKDLVDFADTYKVDGFDFDWEFPNTKGIGCNTNSPSDSDNYIAFLRELRKTMNATIEISVDGGVVPFLDQNGQPMTNVSGFADVVNHFTVLNFDIFGSWSTHVGPNAPLDDSCSTDKLGSAVSAIKAWEAAGLPPSKMFLGVPAYGHGFTVTQQDALQGTNIIPNANFSHTRIPAGTGENVTDAPLKDVCGVVQPITTGIFTFKGLIDAGYLDSSGKPAKGINYRYDNCSQTPFVYNNQTQVMVSYDNELSFAAKKAFITTSKLGGVGLWNAAGDSPDNILVNAIHG